MPVLSGTYLKKALFAGIYFLAVLVLIMLMGEAYCRWKGVCPLRRFYVADWPSQALFVPSNILPYELAPHIPNRFNAPGERGEPYYSNALGMRDKERTVKKGRGIFRCIVLGDSVTMFGHYTEYLEETLNKKYGNRVEVLNCALGGQGIKDYYYNLRYRCLRFEPDLLVIGFCLNDFNFTPILYRTRDGKLQNYREARLFKGNFDNFLFLHSSLYRFIVTRIEARHRIDGYTLGKTYVGKINEIAEERGIPLVAVIFPYLTEGSEDLKEYKTIKRVVDEFHIPSIDLHTAFPKKERKGHMIYPWDVVHLDDQAHRTAAACIAQYFSEHDLITLR
jgi:hypothetical protein